MKVDQSDWQRLEFELTPDATCEHGRLVIALKEGGAVDLGYVFLQPGEWGRFKGLQVRKDVAEGLIAEGLTVLRYGGSMINHPEYRWKKMIGPRDRRQPYHGTWYPYATNGWGIIDFLAFCEAAGFLAIPAFNMDESPQDMADFVEYVNGPAGSPWGQKRAADGHPAPFGLKYLELGNEETVNDAYWEKFQPLAEAIWRVDPAITPVVGDFEFRQHIQDAFDFAGSPVIKSLAAHQKILNFARARKHPVWFDVHIWNDSLRDCDLELEVLGELIEHLGKLSPAPISRSACSRKTPTTICSAAGWPTRGRSMDSSASASGCRSCVRPTVCKSTARMTTAGIRGCCSFRPARLGPSPLTT